MTRLIPPDSIPKVNGTSSHGGVIEHRRTSFNPVRGLWNLLAAPPVPFLITKRSDARVLSLIEAAGPDAVVLNVGAGGKTLGKRVINLDIYPTSSTHALASVFSLPFPDRSADLIILQGVLEHVPRPEVAVAEITRVLKPGAIFYTEMPFLEPYHEAPIDVSRRTKGGLASLCLPLTEVESGIHIGPASTLTWILREFLALLISGGHPIVYRRACSLIGWVVFPLSYLDYWLERQSHFHRIASSFYYLGRKQD